ncbi:hypothetical protein LIER_42121 [Lithospermum erythrorhizon]|uniref:Uncharacterized protein n=1 Tax=Lithospermum erythrorhizon TaxID=34254 RepID=A0AAV3RLL4_LITER
MEEDETISTYNSKIKDIANESFALGEVMSNEKMVRKSPTKKGIALKASCEDEDREDLTKTMSLLAKNFNKTLKCFIKKNPILEGTILVSMTNRLISGGKSPIQAMTKGIKIMNSSIVVLDEILL